MVVCCTCVFGHPQDDDGHFTYYFERYDNHRDSQRFATKQVDAAVRCVALRCVALRVVVVTRRC